MKNCSEINNADAGGWLTFEKIAEPPPSSGAMARITKHILQE